MSNAFMDVRCLKCKARFGFHIGDKLPKFVVCPKCGHKIKRSALREMQAEVKAAIAQTIKRFKKKKRFRPSGPTPEHAVFHKLNRQLIRQMNKRFDHVKQAFIDQFQDAGNHLIPTSNAWDFLVNIFYIQHTYTHKSACDALAEILAVPKPRVYELYSEIRKHKVPKPRKEQK